MDIVHVGGLTVLYTIFKYVLFRPVVAWLMRARVVGEQNIPQAGGAIIAGNHIGEGETFVLPAMISRRMVFPAKKELFNGRTFGTKILAWFLKVIGMVPLDRSGGRTSLESLRPVLDVLAAGGLIGIFPEGTRSPDGRLYKGKTGVARLALAARVPVIPVGFENTQTIKTRIGIPWISRPVVKIGPPLEFSAHYGGHDDFETVRWVTDEVMNGIMALSGQQYVDAYGASVKYGSLSAEEADARILPRPGYGKQPPALSEGTD